MSKFLLNLLVQISKALVHSKIKFYSEKNFPHFRPNRPSSQPVHLDFRPRCSPFFSFPTGRFPPPHWASASQPAQLTSRPSWPPSSASCTGAKCTRRHRRPASRRPHGLPRRLHRKKKMAASIPLHFPINRHHSPSSITSKRRLQSEAIEAPSTPAIEGAQPPPPRLRPIEGHPALGEDSHTSNAPSLSPQRALVVALLCRSSIASETPLHRLPSRGNPIIELACPSFPSPAPRPELSGTGAAGGRAPMSSRAWQWPPVHRGPGRRGPRTRGLGPRVFL
jgi:hypothetical protein